MEARKINSIHSEVEKKSTERKCTSCSCNFDFPSKFNIGEFHSGISRFTCGSRGGNRRRRGRKVRRRKLNNKKNVKKVVKKKKRTRRSERGIIGDACAGIPLKTPVQLVAQQQQQELEEQEAEQGK